MLQFKKSDQWKSIHVWCVSWHELEVVMGVWWTSGSHEELVPQSVNYVVTNVCASSQTTIGARPEAAATKLTEPSRHHTNLVHIWSCRWSNWLLVRHSRPWVLVVRGLGWMANCVFLSQGHSDEAQNDAPLYLILHVTFHDNCRDNSR